MPPPYLPVGKCIYCGADRYSDDRQKLGDEHIVPYCLDGKEVLPEASCKQCEGKTGGVEQHLFGEHGHYRAARVVAKSDSREKGTKNVPLYIGGTFVDGRPQGARRLNLPSDEVGPRLVALVSLTQRPPVLKGLPIDDPSGGKVSIFFTDLARRGMPMSSHGLKENFSPPAVNLVMLLRFLSKIAHAHAAAEFGVDGFEPLLAAFIRGESNPPFGLFGHHNKPFFPGGNFHRPYAVRHSVKSVKGILYVVVDIAVLIDAAFPRYSVVAGTVKSGK